MENNESIHTEDIRVEEKKQSPALQQKESPIVQCREIPKPLVIKNSPSMLYRDIPRYHFTDSPAASYRDINKIVIDKKMSKGSIKDSPGTSYREIYSPKSFTFSDKDIRSDSARSSFASKEGSIMDDSDSSAHSKSYENSSVHTVRDEQSEIISNANVSVKPREGEVTCNCSFNMFRRKYKKSSP